MEKIFKIQGILFILFLTSCSGILIVNPPDQISQTSFWKTPSDAQYGLDGVYSRLKTPGFGFSCFNYNVGFNDVLGGDLYRNSLDFLTIAQGNADVNSGLVSSTWAFCASARRSAARAWRRRCSMCGATA